MLSGAVQGQDLGRSTERSCGPSGGSYSHPKCHSWLPPAQHLGGDEVLQPPQEPSIQCEVHSIAVLHPGLQEAEAPPVDLGEGRGGVLVSPGADRGGLSPGALPAATTWTVASGKQVCAGSE